MDQNATNMSVDLAGLKQVGPFVPREILVNL